MSLLWLIARIIFESKGGRKGEERERERENSPERLPGAAGIRESTNA